jgi:lipopolysaccharide transport system permease protein
VNPIVMLAVYTVAFTYIIKIRTEMFVFFLLLGILPWTFFAGSLTMSTGSIVENGGLLKSIFFPRAVLPISTVVFNLAQFLLTAVVLIPVMLVVFGVAPAWPMILFPVFVSLQLVFTAGLAMALATGTAFFRDIKHLLEIALAVMFWTTPILYQFGDVPANLRPVIFLSPLSPFVLAYHQIFYYRLWPDFSIWAAVLGHSAVAFTIGAALFLAYQDQLSEQV